MDNVTDKNPGDSKLHTPLHLAAKGGHMQIVKAIMNHVTDKNPIDKEGQTPMALFLRHATSEQD